MVAKKQPVVLKQSTLPEEGEEYVIGFGGKAWSNPTVDFDKFWEILQNPYVVQNLEKQKSLLFSDYMEIHVYNIESGEEDEDLANVLLEMCMKSNMWGAMQKAWMDISSWGPCIIDPVWAMQGSERTLIKVRRLPPESFGTCPTLRLGQVSHDLLGGITQNPDTKEIELWQTDNRGHTNQLKKSMMFTDPSSPGVGGKSKLYPLSSLVSMLDFAMLSQMQKTNRIGAPIMFIRFITAPQTACPANGNLSDLAFAKKILENWGKGTAYTLRPNMELVNVDFGDNQTALDTVKHLIQEITNFFTPSTFIKKAGEGSLGSTGGSEAEMFRLWMAGQHKIIEQFPEKLLNEYLESNGYVGYRAEVNIPMPEEDRTMAMLEEAKIGSGAMGGKPTLSRNEVRKRLGEPELSDEELDKIAEEWKTVSDAGLLPPMPGQPMPGQPKPGEPPVAGKGEELPLEPDEGKEEKFQDLSLVPDKKQVPEGVKVQRSALDERLNGLYDEHEKRTIALLKGISNDRPNP